MIAAIRSARRAPSRLAMALALMGGALAVTAFSADEAQAQRRTERPANAEAPQYTPAFVAVYQPVANLTTGDMPNFEGARSQLETVIAAAQSADDRNAAGNLTLIVGNHFDDDVLKRRGLELMVGSGKVAADRIGQFQYFIGGLAYNAQDYAAARTALQAAIAAGYSDGDGDVANDPEYIITQSYFAEDQGALAVQNVLTQAAAASAAGNALPERLLLLALQESYEAQLTAQATQVSALLLDGYPSEQNWLNVLQVANALTDYSPSVRVDLLRLMRETGALTQRQEYARLIEDLDPRTMGTEVLAVLDAAATADVFPADDDYAVEITSIARPRAAADRAEMASLTREADSGDGQDAFVAGNVLYSLGEYAQAERYFQLAIDRGHEPEAARLRLGMAQVKQGNHAAAQTTLGAVTGERQQIAQLWALYAKSLAS